MSHDLVEILTFHRVAEAGSVTRAAGRLNVAKSLVSRRLASLEARLGARLVTRTARGAALTDPGLAYYRETARIVAALDEAARAAAGRHARPWGTLRVAAPTALGRRRLLPAVGRLLAAHPELDVDVALLDREVDLAGEGFDLQVRVGDLRDSGLVARRLAPIRRALYAGPGYRARRGAPAGPGDLAGHEHRAARRHRLRANDEEMLRDAALAGFGVAALPERLAAPALGQGELAVVLPGHPLEPLAVHALYRPGPLVAQKVRAMLDALSAEPETRPAPRPGPAPALAA